MAEFHSGKDGNASVDGVTLAVISWSVTTSVDHAEFRNSKTGRHTVIDPTFFPPVPITIVVDRDFAANPFSAAPALTVGKFVENVKLYEAAGGTTTPAGEFYNFPSAMVKSVPHEVVIDGKIGLSFQLMSSGAYTYPGAVDPTSNIDSYTIGT